MHVPGGDHDADLAGTLRIPVVSDEFGRSGPLPSQREIVRPILHRQSVSIHPSIGRGNETNLTCGGIVDIGMDVVIRLPVLQSTDLFLGPRSEDPHRCGERPLRSILGPRVARYIMGRSGGWRRWELMFPLPGLVADPEMHLSGLGPSQMDQSGIHAEEGHLSMANETESCHPCLRLRSRARTRPSSVWRAILTRVFATMSFIRILFSTKRGVTPEVMREAR